MFQFNTIIRTFSMLRMAGVFSAWLVSTMAYAAPPERDIPNDAWYGHPDAEYAVEFADIVYPLGFHAEQNWWGDLSLLQSNLHMGELVFVDANGDYELGGNLNAQVLAITDTSWIPLTGFIGDGPTFSVNSSGSQVNVLYSCDFYYWSNPSYVQENTAGLFIGSGTNPAPGNNVVVTNNATGLNCLANLPTMQIGYNGTARVYRRPADSALSDGQFDIRVGLDGTTTDQKLINSVNRYEDMGYGVNVGSTRVPVHCIAPSAMQSGTAVFDFSSVTFCVAVYDAPTGGNLVTEFGFRYGTFLVATWDIATEGHSKTYYLEVKKNFDARELILDDGGDAKDSNNQPFDPALDRARIATCGCDDTIKECLPLTNAQNASLNFHVDLGTINGESAGYLALYAKEPDASVDLGSTDLLFHMAGSGVEIQDSSGNPAADGRFDDDGDKIVPLASGSDWGWVELDVNPSGSNAYEYHILFKRPNGTVYRTVRVEDPDGDGGGDKMYFSETLAVDGQSATRVWHFEWDNTDKGWVLSEGIDNSGTVTYERVTRRESTTSGNTRTETVTVEEADTTVVSKVVEVYQLVGTGERLIERTVDPDGLALREAWTFDTGSSTYGEPASYLSPTGYWERYVYEYDYDDTEDYIFQRTVIGRLGGNTLGGNDSAADNVEVVTSAWALTLYSSPNEEEVTLERIQTRVEGVDTAMRYRITRYDGSTVAGCVEEWDVTFVDANPEAGTASTMADIIAVAEDLLDGTFTGEAIIAKYWRWEDGQATDDSGFDDLKQVLLSNGTMRFYERAVSGNLRTTITSDGIPNSARTSIITGRRVTRTVDESNRLVSLLTEQIAEGTNEDNNVPQWFYVSLVKASSPDGVGRPQREDFYFGAEAKAEWLSSGNGTASYFTIQTFGCCGGGGQSSYTGRSGVVSKQEQDILGRTVSRVSGYGSTSAQFETEYDHDAAGRVLTTTRKPLASSGQPDLVTTVTYNLAGQVIEAVDEEGRKTYVRYRRVTPAGAYFAPDSDGDYYFETLVYGHDNDAPVSVVWTDSRGNKVLESTASSTSNWPPSTDPEALPVLTEESRTVYLYDWAGRPTETWVYHSLSGGVAGGGLAAPGSPGTNYLVIQAQAYDPAGRPTTTTDVLGNVIEPVYAEGSFRGIGTRMGLTGSTVDVARVFYQEFESGNTDMDPQGAERPYAARSYYVRPNLLDTPIAVEDINGDLADFVYTDTFREFEVVDDALVRHLLWTQSAPGGGPWSVTEYNAQGQRVALRTTENGNSSNVLSSQTYTYHPLSGASSQVTNNGRLAQVDRWYDGNEAGNSIRTTLHYDDADRIVKTETSGGGFSKIAFDDYGRVVREVFASSEGGTHDPLSFTGDVVLTETVTGYNKAEQVIQTTVYHRAHDATATGLLSSAAATQYRVSYGVVWFDDNGRLTHSATYGNNGGVALTDYDPGEPNVQSYGDGPPPTNSSDDVQVSVVAYNAAGYPYLTTANDDVQSRTYFNAAGQITYVVENYQANSLYWDTTAEDPGSPDDRRPTHPDIHNDINRITEYVYDHSVSSGGGGQLVQVIRVDPDGDGDRADDQTTHYINSGELASDRRGYVPRNGRPAAVLYPDALVATSRASAISAMNTNGDESGGASGGGDFATVQLYADGQRYRLTDRRGVAWTTEYTTAGQVEHRRVTSTGSWSAVGNQRVAYTYGDAGEVLTVTAYSDAAGSNATSEVTYTYDGFYNRLTDVQNLNPAAFGGGNDLTVARAYDTTASGGQYTHGYRLAQLTYPNGREVELVYDGHGGIDNAIGRANGIDEVLGGSNVAVTRYSYLGNGLVVRKDYPVPDVRLDLIDEGAEGVIADRYDASLDRLGRVGRFQWERYDSNGDGAGVSGSDGEDIIHTTHAFDRVGQQLYSRGHVYSGYSEVYRHDSLRRVTGRDVGPIVLDSQGDVELDVDGLASVESFWQVNGLDAGMDQLGNPLSVDSESSNGRMESDINDASEITALRSDATDPIDESRVDFDNGSGEEDIFTDAVNCDLGTDLSIVGNALEIDAGSTSAPAIVLLPGDRGPLPFTTEVQIPTTQAGLVGYVVGYKSHLDYWVYAKNFATGDGDWELYHIHDDDSSGSIDYGDPDEKEYIDEYNSSGTAAAPTSYGIWNRPLGSSFDESWLQFDLEDEGGFPSGRYGLYTEITGATFNLIRAVSGQRVAALGPAWETTNSNGVIDQGSNNGQLHTSGTWHRQYKPILLRGLEVQRFQVTFTMERNDNTDTSYGKFIFNYRGPDDYDFIKLYHHLAGNAPQAQWVRNGGSAQSMAEDRAVDTSAIGEPFDDLKVDDDDVLWYRIVSDGENVKVFASGSESGLDARQAADEWVMQTSSSTERFAFSDGPGRIGFTGGSYHQYWDNIKVESDPDNNASLTSESSFELIEFEDSFDLTSGKIESSFTYDGNGNLTFDGVFRYAYDGLNRLAEVRMAGNAAGTTPGSVLASYRYDGLGRLIEEKEQTPEAVQLVVRNIYDGWNIIETRDGAIKLGGVPTSQNIWDSLAGHTIDSLAQVGHNLNAAVDDDSSTAGSQHHVDARLYVLQDQLSNVVGVVTSKGILVERYEYDQNGRRFTYRPGTLDYALYAMADVSNDGDVDVFEAGGQGDVQIVISGFGSATAWDRASGEVTGDSTVDSADEDFVYEEFLAFTALNDRKAYNLAGTSHRMDYGKESGLPLMRHGMQGHVQDDRLGIVHMRRRAFTTNAGSGGGMGRFLQRDPIGYTDGGNLYHAYFQSWQTTDPMGLSAGGADNEVLGYWRFREDPATTTPSGDTMYHFWLEEYMVTGTETSTVTYQGGYNAYGGTVTTITQVEEWIPIIGYHPETPGPNFDECYEGEAEEMIRSMEGSRTRLRNLAAGNNQTIDQGKRAGRNVMLLEIAMSLVPYGSCVAAMEEGDYETALREAIIETVLIAATAGIGKYANSARNASRAIEEATRHVDEIAEAGARVKPRGGSVSDTFTNTGDEFYNSGRRTSQPASEDLLNGINGRQRHGRTLEIHQSDDVTRRLDSDGANASIICGDGFGAILLRADPKKLEVIEEFLHNVQYRLGMFNRGWSRDQIERHVKDFMLRHRRMLGFDDVDEAWLRNWLDDADKLGITLP